MQFVFALFLAHGFYIFGIEATDDLDGFVPVRDYRCRNVATVPRNFSINHDEIYKFAEPTMQIFSELRIPCDGYLTQWRFLAKNPIVYGLHLAVFRPAKNASLIFEIVGESYLRALATPEAVHNTWIYYPLETPISVLAGDFLGFYYDNFAAVYDMLTVGGKSRYDLKNRNLRPTYVMLLDQLTIGKNKTIDGRKAYIDIREPALAAIISPSKKSTDEGGNAFIQARSSSRRQRTTTKITQSTTSISDDLTKVMLEEGDSDKKPSSTITTTTAPEAPGVSRKRRRRTTTKPIAPDEDESEDEEQETSAGADKNDGENDEKTVDSSNYAPVMELDDALVMTTETMMPKISDENDEPGASNPASEDHQQSGDSAEPIADSPVPDWLSEDGVTRMKMKPAHENKNNGGENESEESEHQQPEGEVPFVDGTASSEDEVMTSTTANTEEPITTTSTQAAPVSRIRRRRTTSIKPPTTQESLSTVTVTVITSNTKKLASSSASVTMSTNTVMLPKIYQETNNDVQGGVISGAGKISAVCLNPPTALFQCQERTIRVYFDYESGICRLFYGCASWDLYMANNFASISECRFKCVRH